MKEGQDTHLTRSEHVVICCNDMMESEWTVQSICVDAFALRVCKLGLNIRLPHDIPTRLSDMTVCVTLKVHRCCSSPAL